MSGKLVETVMHTIADLQQRSIYGKRKRLKRGVLRVAGRWSRQSYDVQVILQNGRPTYKKITFESQQRAMRISSNLVRFGATPHLPTWRRRENNAIWVDFVAGRPCNHIDDALMPQLAACFGAFALRGSRTIPIERTNYWRRHLINLRYLRRLGVISQQLHAALYRKSASIRPPALRLGFDYGDPIGPNLLYRQRDGSICAIDVKNFRRNTLVGAGLAKVSDRWLGGDRRRYVFAHLERMGLGDIEQAFSFITCYERAARVRRKVRRDLYLHGRVKEPVAKRAKLSQLLD